MYFDTKPKERLEDFYNYRNEHEAFKKALAGDDFLVALKGLRRTGKTSLMRVVYNSLRGKKIWIDTRSVKNLEKAIMEGMSGKLNELSPKEMISSAVEGLNFYLQLRKQQRTEYFHEVLEKTDRALAGQNAFLYIFIDEIQRFPKIPPFLAFIFDNSKRVKIIVSGSEVGLLERILGERYESALFGRPRVLIEMKHLPEEKSADFLRKGAEMAHMKLTEAQIKEAVGMFNGTIGWLTLYGHYAKTHGHEKALADVQAEGKKVVAHELNKFFMDKGEATANYRKVLKLLAGGEKRWSEITVAFNVDDRKISKYLGNLISHGFVRKESGKYIIADPLLREYLRG